jgi:hypothetical protein
MSAHRFGAPIDITALHPIVDDHLLFHRAHTWLRSISSTGCGRKYT